MVILHEFIFQEQSDLHLKDYDSEIFDDDDFYHQVIKNGFIYFSIKLVNVNIVIFQSV